MYPAWMVSRHKMTMSTVTSLEELAPNLAKRLAIGKNEDDHDDEDDEDDDGDCKKRKPKSDKHHGEIMEDDETEGDEVDESGRRCRRDWRL
jgi:hypothetical protein